MTILTATARTFLLAALALPAAFLHAQDSTSRVHENKVAGLSVTRPAGWRVASEQAIIDNRARVQFSTAELQAAVEQMAALPLFAFMKHPEGHPSINPTIQIAARPSAMIGTATARDVLTQVASTMQTSFAEYSLVTPIESAEISALPGAYMKAHYTLKGGGVDYKIAGRLWVVIRGESVFIVGMSGPQNGPDASDKEFEETLRSIVIQR